MQINWGISLKHKIYKEDIFFELLLLESFIKDQWYKENKKLSPLEVIKLDLRNYSFEESFILTEIRSPIFTN